ncbi:hypothetical protein NLU14_08850 [Marinobacter sp. 71-i]|uniref:Uncharacterized protein n=1 Tax=Marinobacter iranensis TaxID=2962607 RepID=A0ABT5Y9J2_9GAMM|nr:hypothetical protein [Marinobacter iranensis]MDF0750338.1 hypothetical protein [Marinobacter iranensis]
MSNDITTNKSPMEEFQDRVKDKLKADIGSMLPDDVLAQLTQRAVDEQFFKERRAPNPRGYGSDVARPSWFVEEVAKIAEPIIRSHIEQFIETSKADIEAAIKQYISDQNLTLTASAMIASQMSAHMYNNVDMIVQAIMNHQGR